MSDQGVRSPPGTAGQGLSRRSRYAGFWVLLAAILVGVNGFYALTAYTRGNRTECLSCHPLIGASFMVGGVARHRPGLACFQCHGALPGQQALSGSFSAKPDVVNPNCMGCHPRILAGTTLGKDVEVRLAQSAGSKVYQWKLEDLMYRWHLEKRICLCTDCHRNVAHEKASGAAQPHRPKLAYCGECHYHAAKDDYVKAQPLPAIEVREVSQGLR